MSSTIASAQSSHLHYQTGGGTSTDGVSGKANVAWEKFASRSVLIRSVPWALASAGFSSILIAIRDSEEFSYLSSAIKHPFAVQVFGIMFAFLLTNRVVRAIGRWWEGLTTCNTMYLKWYDAFSFIMFNIKKEQKVMEIQGARTDLSESDMTWIKDRTEQLNDFSQKMIHWFSLMNALALGTLKHGEAECIQNIHCKASDFSWLGKSTSRKPSKENSNSSRMDAVRQAFVGSKAANGDLTYLGDMTKDERKLLVHVEDKMYLSVQWIMQALVIADQEKLVEIAPPILTRVYVAIQDGVGAYNVAYKLAAVPYPYPLAQMMTLLMYAFVILMPIVIEKFTQSMILTPLLSFGIVLSYWGLNRVARELENPFGDDPNDLPLHDFCASFNDNVEQMSVLQYGNELDNVFTFSEMCNPKKARMPLKKPAALSNPPAPAKEKAADTSKVVTEDAQPLKVKNPSSVVHPVTGNPSQEKQSKTRQKNQPNSVAHIAPSEVDRGPANPRSNQTPHTIIPVYAEGGYPQQNHHRYGEYMDPPEINGHDIIVNSNEAGYLTQGGANDGLSYMYVPLSQVMQADNVQNVARRKAPVILGAVQNPQPKAYSFASHPQYSEVSVIAQPLAQPVVLSDDGQRQQPQLFVQRRMEHQRPNTEPQRPMSAVNVVHVQPNMEHQRPMSAVNMEHQRPMSAVIKTVGTGSPQKVPQLDHNSQAQETGHVIIVPNTVPYDAMPSSSSEYVYQHNQMPQAGEALPQENLLC